MKLDHFIAKVQAWLSLIYLACTFFVIIIYELGWSRLTSPGQEKTFDSMVNWMTGGALIVLYFWLQRAKAVSPPDPATTSIDQTTITKTTPTEPPHAPITDQPDTPIPDHVSELRYPGSPDSDHV